MSILSILGFETAYAADATSASTGGPQGGVLQMLFLPVLLIAVFYFLLIRPQSRRAKEQRLMLSKMMVGDEVMTSGGILGRIVALRDAYVILQIAKNVEMTLQKSAITSLLPKGTVEGMD